MVTGSEPLTLMATTDPPGGARMTGPLSPPTDRLERQSFLNDERFIVCSRQDHHLAARIDEVDSLLNGCRGFSALHVRVHEH